VTIVDTDRIVVIPTQNSTPEEDDTNIVDDDANEFIDEEEAFILMTPAAMLSQQIASQTQGSLVSFQ
jgi:enhancing lycopene biosynthesis protein 2